MDFSHRGHSLWATNKREWRKGRGSKREVGVDSLLWVNNDCLIPLNDSDVCFPSPSQSYHHPTLNPSLHDVVTWLAPSTCDVVNTSSAPTAFTDSVTDSCSPLFHYPCPPPHSSPQYLMAWVRGHRSITSSPGRHMTVWHFALWSAKILHLFWAHA